MATQHKVILVHGLWSDGDWYVAAKRALQPHFECVELGYGGYRVFGVISMVFGHWMGILFLLWIVAALTTSIPRSIGLCGALVLFVLAVAEPFWRRHSTVNKVKAKLDQHNGSGLPPHLIAHSLGTYLVGTAIAKYPDLRFDRLIFIGCVLPRSFDWNSIYSRSTTKKKPVFRDLRNEVGGRDWVVSFAGMLAKILPASGVGIAGRKGFLADKREYVHDVTNSWTVCEHCTDKASKLTIHNIPLDQFEHVDQFRSPRYAEKFWLPYLWGLHPSEYEDFLESCVSAYQLQKQRNEAALADAELRLFNKEFSWVWSDSPLNYLASVVKRLKRLLDKRNIRYEKKDLMLLGAEVIRKTWQEVSEAVAERDKLGGERNEDRLYALNPRAALDRALDHVKFKMMERNRGQR